MPAFDGRASNDATIAYLRIASLTEHPDQGAGTTQRSLSGTILIPSPAGSAVNGASPQPGRVLLRWTDWESGDLIRKYLTGEIVRRDCFREIDAAMTSYEEDSERIAGRCRGLIVRSSPCQVQYQNTQRAR